MGETRRMAKCQYFGGTTHEMKKYSCCCCDKCRAQFVDGKTSGKCNCIVESRPDLAFFTARPDSPMDEYYCGCKGWE